MHHKSLTTRVEDLENYVRSQDLMLDHVFRIVGIMLERIDIIQRALDSALEVLSESPKADNNPARSIHKR